jgi:2-iminobutanoate/2-iminopropanoate deaminase
MALTPYFHFCYTLAKKQGDCMNKIESNKAPKAIGPYSQGISVNSGPFIFLSGQLGIDIDTGLLVEGGVLQETEKVFDHIEALLSEAGLTLKNVVRMDVFLTNMDDFAAMNQVYAKRFQGLQYPARFALEVSKLPLNGSVEIAAIASGDDS